MGKKSSKSHVVIRINVSKKYRADVYSDHDMTLILGKRVLFQSISTRKLVFIGTNMYLWNRPSYVCRSIPEKSCHDQNSTDFASLRPTNVLLLHSKKGRQRGGPD